MKKILSIVLSLSFLTSFLPLSASAACSPVALGGTGWCNFVSGAVIYGNGTSALATTTAGTNGQFLSLTGGVPTWTTVTAASSTLLTDNNTFSGNNLFSASTTFSTLVNIRNASTSLSTFGTAWFPNITAYNLIATDANSKAVATSSIGNSLLANSTISGISLGGTLGALSATDATLTFSGSYTGATARTVGVNLGNTNIWTALQNQSNTGTTTFSGGIESGTKIAAPYLIATSTTATSTFAGGIKSPCFSNDGIACLGSGSGTVGSGTTGQLPYYAGIGTALTATSSLFLSTAGNLGIGSTSPTAILSVLQPNNYVNSSPSLVLGVWGATSSPAGGVLQGQGIFLQTGVGGVASGSIGGAGGDFTIQTGSGGTSDVTTGRGGMLNILLGSGGSGTNGNANIGTSSLAAAALNVQNTNSAKQVVNFYSAAGGSLLNLSNAGLLTFTSATSTNITVSGSFQLPNSSNPSPLSAGYLTMSTNSPYQLHIGNGAGGTAVFDPQFHLTISSPATSTWSGTSTAPSFVWPRAATIQNIYCTVQPTGATLNVQVQYANSSAYSTVNATMVPASTTPGQYTFASNNIPTTAATSTISFGTPAGSPTTASCTLLGVWTGI